MTKKLVERAGRPAFGPLWRVAVGCLAGLMSLYGTAVLPTVHFVPDAVSVVHAVDLPSEAQETLALIRQHGPFPHARDGAVFANREGRLPYAPRGTYREYTVRTPGSRDRGARRIIAGKGKFWYTADHYRSFRRIVE